MARKSVRLQDVGSYTEEESPTLSYREVLYGFFRWKKSPGGGQHHMDSSDPHESMNENDSADTAVNHESTVYRLRSRIITRTQGIDPTERTPSSNTIGRKQIIACFLLLLLLAIEGRKHRLRPLDESQQQAFAQRRLHPQGPRLISCTPLTFHNFDTPWWRQYTHSCNRLKEVQQEVQMFKQCTNTPVPLADTMANFALESLGAGVLHHLSSDTYWSKGAGTWDRLYFRCYSSKAQRRVIQGQSPLLPVQCWTFAGSHGYLFVSLSHPVSITHVTLGHIPKSQSPDGHISRSPREFSIYGMRTTDEEGTYLGTLVYDQDSAAFQTFELPNPDKGVFRYVKLQINSNWGHMENTFLYSFRVRNSKV